MKTRILLLVLTVFLFSCSQKEEIKRDTDEVMFGIDVSHYQTIDWDVVKNQKEHPVEFVIVRATMGTRKDEKFSEYFTSAKKNEFLVGAYHYYDPNENSKLQAQKYLKTVSPFLEKGDFVPVLDIERLGGIQSKKRLLQGLKNWVKIVESEFGVKPIIYTSLSFWEDHLDNHFPEYPLWLATYTPNRRTQTREICQIHQFTENVRIQGIKECVDGNDLNKKYLPTLVLNQ